MKYQNIREEELKNKVANDWFSKFDTTKIIGNLDFCVCMRTPPNPTPPAPQRGKEGELTPPNPLTEEVTPPNPLKEGEVEQESLLWAEAKTGDFDIHTMFVQLILTIGKARTFDKIFPPAFLGAFDFKKIAFVPYASVQDIFYLNDFNWNVTPSNHETKEFKLIKERIEATLQENTYVYDYLKDEKELKFFIANNIAKATELSKIKIDKNNFVPIYLRWLETIKPIIDVNWDDVKKANILDSDFYLADLFVDDKDTNTIEDDLTIRDNLFVIYENQGYKIAKENIKQMFDATINIKAKNTYQQFWKRYKRPPIKEFQGYIIERRDLLVPQDIRERKGAFFTPRVWVELSQKYLADVLGENWQDEYYIWDCAAGTGNLLAGLTNKYNIWASTLDQADVNVMQERILHGANLLENHVFQFDFLNDDFDKLPKPLQEIINNEEKRKKLVVYINPPYAEAGDAKQRAGTGKNKSKTAIDNKTYLKYRPQIGKASNELFTQFLIRIYCEIPGARIANFSTLKNLQSSNFLDFRNEFRAKLEKIFLVPADTFDNVKGKFPIGFFIWNGEIKEKFEKIEADVYDKDGRFICNKFLYGNLRNSINVWLKTLNNKRVNFIGFLMADAPDFQNNNLVSLLNSKQKRHGIFISIDSTNLTQMCIYLSVRHCIEATWLNDRDQFLYPNEGWASDKEFQNDCLAYTLFHGQNRITSKEGTNHWIPFTEQEVNAREKFESNFMSKFISGKIKIGKEVDLFTSHNLNSPSVRGLGGVNSQVLGGVNSQVLGGVNSQVLGGVKITPTYLTQHNISIQNLIFSDDYLPYNPNLKTNSRDLRKARNLSEVILWEQLRADNFLGYSFYRQKPILNYIADFYCKELNLIIEIDGSSHGNDDAKEYDQERDRQMQVLGLRILRLNDGDVKKNIDGVLRVIEDFITPPNPLKEGEFTSPEGELTPPNPLKEGELLAGELIFSTEAKAVFDAGKELWRYYHKQKNCNVNASLYDIREHFQGRNEAGKMNNKSEDTTYMELISELRKTLKQLAEKIEPKVYEYEFLKS